MFGFSIEHQSANYRKDMIGNTVRSTYDLHVLDAGVEAVEVKCWYQII